VTRLAAGHILRCAFHQDSPAPAPTLRPQVDDVVGCLDDIEMVLDDDHRVTGSDQPMEAVQQP